MGVEASPEPHGASEAAAATPEAVTELLGGAPEGWHKKLALKSGGTPRRKDVVFVAPGGEEIRSKSQLERYIKANPDGPLLSQFDWSTGETPRRSGRLSSKPSQSTDSPDTEPPVKRGKRTPAKDSKESDETPPAKRAKRGRPPKGFKEDDKVETNPSEMATLPVKESEDEEIETKSSESKEAENTDNNQIKEPESEPVLVPVSLLEPVAVAVAVKDSKEVVDTENELATDGFVKDKNAEVVQSKNESLVKVIKEDEDTEMKDVSPVLTNNLEGVAEYIKDDSAPTKVSTIEVTEDIYGSHDLHPKVEVQAAVEREAKETNKNLDFTEMKKDDVNGGCLASEAHDQDEHVETVHSEADHAKPEIAAYFGVTKPQEAHPAEVGVSS